MTTGPKFAVISGGSGRFGDCWEIYCYRRGQILRCWNFLSGSGTRVSVIRFLVLCNVGGNNNYGGEKPFRIPKADYG